MFDGFVLDHVRLPEVTLRVRHGGSGPPVVLLQATRGRTRHGTG